MSDEDIELGPATQAEIFNVADFLDDYSDDGFIQEARSSNDDGLPSNHGQVEGAEAGTGVSAEGNKAGIQSDKADEGGPSRENKTVIRSDHGNAGGPSRQNPVRSKDVTSNDKKDTRPPSVAASGNREIVTGPPSAAASGIQGLDNRQQSAAASGVRVFVNQPSTAAGSGVQEMTRFRGRFSTPVNSSVQIPNQRPLTGGPAGNQISNQRPLQVGGPPGNQIPNQRPLQVGGPAGNQHHPIRGLRRQPRPRRNGYRQNASVVAMQRYTDLIERADRLALRIYRNISQTHAPGWTILEMFRQLAEIARRHLERVQSTRENLFR